MGASANSRSVVQDLNGNLCGNFRIDCSVSEVRHMSIGRAMSLQGRGQSFAAEGSSD